MFQTIIYKDRIPGSKISDQGSYWNVIRSICDRGKTSLYNRLSWVWAHHTSLFTAQNSANVCNRLYNMINETAYQSNLFATALLIHCENIAAYRKKKVRIILIFSVRSMRLQNRWVSNFTTWWKEVRNIICHWISIVSS